jgi:hypothetical protein
MSACLLMQLDPSGILRGHFYNHRLVNAAVLPEPTNDRVYLTFVQEATFDLPSLFGQVNTRSLISAKKQIQFVVGND